MANIKKAIIKTEELPQVASDGKYYFRYRIKSPDGLVTSQWSDIKAVTGNSVVDIRDVAGFQTNTVPIYAEVTPDESQISLSWDPVGSSLIKTSEYDVFVKREYVTEPEDSYSYFATSKSNTFNFPILSSNTLGKPMYVNFIIQLASVQKELNTDLQIGELQNVSTIYVVSIGGIDGGVI